MTDSKKDRGKRQARDEFTPDAWERFERAVDVVAKSKPKPRSRRKADDKLSKPATKKAKPQKS